MMRVVMKVLPDGTGRVRIHYFVHAPQGPVKTAGSTTMTALGPVNMGGAVGYIACMPKRESVLPEEVNGFTHLCVHSNDSRAVTCDLCMKTPEYLQNMKALGEIVETAQEG